MVANEPSPFQKNFKVQIKKGPNKVASREPLPFPNAFDPQGSPESSPEDTHFQKIYPKEDIDKCYISTSFFLQGSECAEEEVTCEVCGKVYKHKSCLVKHYWEHNKYWDLTKGLCENKHQQVQLLEAANLLMQFHTAQAH